MNSDTINNIGKGIIGSGAIEVINSVPSNDDTFEIIKLLSQVVVAIATILSLFKKKK